MKQCISILLITVLALLGANNLVGHLHDDELHCVEDGNHYCPEENHHHCDLCDTLTTLVFTTPSRVEINIYLLQKEVRTNVNGSLTETITLCQRDRAPPVA